MPGVAINLINGTAADCLHLTQNIGLAPQKNVYVDYAWMRIQKKKKTPPLFSLLPLRVV